MLFSKTKNVIIPLLTVFPLKLYDIIHQQLVNISYYHMISDSEVKHIKHLYNHKNVTQFNSDIEYLLKNFSSIHLEDLLLFTKKGQKLPQKPLMLTFDDGFREMHDIVAPILLKKGIPATFFINRSFTDNRNLCFQHKASLIADYLLKKNISNATQIQIVNLLQNEYIQAETPVGTILSINYQQRDRIDQVAEHLDIDFNDYLIKNKPYLTTEQINKMISEGFTIGAHSTDHPLYSELTLEEQLRQTIESVTFVRDTFNLNYGAFAFPHSDYGVSKKYFDEIAKSRLVDISFGTAGMMDDCIPNNLQRFSLEKPLLPAKNILALQSAKRLWRIVKRSNRIIRREG